jgi:predicted nucleic acid-binding protein
MRFSQGGKTQAALCRKDDLTAYDAAYLEISIRGGYPLATADADARAAAEGAYCRVSIGVTVCRKSLIEFI